MSVPVSFQYGAISSGTSCFLPQSLQTKDHPSGHSMAPIIAPPCFTPDERAFLRIPTAAPRFQGLAWVKCQSHNQSMKCGYARVSTDDQSTALQFATLKRAGCKLLFKDGGLSGAVVCAACAADEC